jgi:hypothetical protein
MGMDDVEGVIGVGQRVDVRDRVVDATTIRARSGRDRPKADAINPDKWIINRNCP